MEHIQVTIGVKANCNVLAIITGLDIFNSLIRKTENIKTDSGRYNYVVVLCLLFFAERRVRTGDREEAAYLKNTRKTLWSCTQTCYITIRGG